MTNMGSVHIKAGEKSSVKALTMVGRVCSYVFLILLALIALCPLILPMIGAFSEFGKNFTEAFSKEFLISFRNSFLIAVASGILSSYFSSMTAYGFHVYDFKLKKFAYGLILIIMLLPTQIYAVGFVNLTFNLGLDDNFLPLIFPSIAAPVVFFYMTKYMEIYLPIEVIEAARIDGAGELMIFHVIALPAVRPAVVVQLLLSFIASWNSYFVPSLILSDNRTLPMWLAALRDTASGESGTLYMTVLLAVIPVVLIYIFASKHIIQLTVDNKQ